jgi:hypothetical protein
VGQQAGEHLRLQPIVHSQQAKLPSWAFRYRGSRRFWGPGVYVKSTRWRLGYLQLLLKTIILFHAWP